MDAETTAPEPAELASKGWWKPVLMLVIIIGLMVASYVFNLGEQLGKLQGWIKSLGTAGYAVFVLVYILATLAAIPGTVLTAGAGTIFGAVIGTVLVSIASTIGASLAFLIARYFARDAASRWLAKNEKFKKLDNLTEREGAMIVAITRIVPLFPFNLLNYGFGLTKVRFLPYVLWSWLCMLPGTALFVISGAAVSQGIKKGEGFPWHLIAVSAGLLVFVFIISRFARKKLKDSTDE